MFSGSEKQLPCCRCRIPDSQMCKLCKGSGTWHSEKTQRGSRQQTRFKNSEAKSSKRHKSYNNKYQKILLLLLILYEVVEATMAVLYCLPLALPHAAVLHGHEKER